MIDQSTTWYEFLLFSIFAYWQLAEEKKIVLNMHTFPALKFFFWYFFWRLYVLSYKAMLNSSKIKKYFSFTNIQSGNWEMIKKKLFCTNVGSSYFYDFSCCCCRLREQKNKKWKMNNEKYSNWTITLKKFS